MAEHFRITVHPTGLAAASLTVGDAMRQVLDFVELLDRAAERDAHTPKIVWLLMSAATNSPPFSVEGEASSPEPAISVSLKANTAKRAIGEAFRELVEERPPPTWMEPEDLRTARRFFQRNLNGVGRTDIDLLDSDEPIIVAPQMAQRAVLAVDRALLETRSAQPNLTRTEYGSAEGEIVSAKTYYSKPALILKHRLTGWNITCVISDEAAKLVSSTNSLEEIWSGKRVNVIGAIHYDANGDISKIDAESVVNVEETEVSLEELREMDLTCGLPPAEYLRRIREADDAGY